MLYTNNVLAEIFAEHMSPALIPIANTYDIGKVLEKVSEMNRNYRDDETRTAHVPEEWHRAVMLEFSDWLSDHMTDGDGISLCRKYKDIPMVKQLMRYQAKELVEELEPIIENMTIEQASEFAATAGTMADLICFMGGEKIVNIAFGEGELLSLFVPSYEGMPVEMSELPEYLTANADNVDAQTAAWYECRLSLVYAISAAMVSDQACISVCATNPAKNDTCSIALMAIVNGQIIMVSPENMNVFFDETDMPETVIAQENLDGIVAHSEIEYRAIVLAAAILTTALLAIESAKEFFRDRDAFAAGAAGETVVVDAADDVSADDAAVEVAMADEVSEVAPDTDAANSDFADMDDDEEGGPTCDVSFSMYSTPLTTQDEDGTAVFSVPDELFGKGYLEFYDGIFSIDPSVDEADAIRMLFAFVVEKTAEEILWYGRSEEAAENIADMFQSLELDRTLAEMRAEAGDDVRADVMSRHSGGVGGDGVVAAGVVYGDAPKGGDVTDVDADFAHFDFGETVEDFLSKIPVRHEGEEGYDLHATGTGRDPREALLNGSYEENNILREFAESVSERRELLLSDSIYEELDESKQAMVRSLLKPVFDYPEKVHAILSVGKNPNENGELSPLMTTVPPNISQFAKDDMMSAARSVITKAMLSGDSYTFISTLDPQEPFITFISMIEWNGGQWRNKNMRELCEYLEEVPIDSALMLHPGDGLVFRRLNADGTFEDLHE